MVQSFSDTVYRILHRLIRTIKLKKNNSAGMNPALCTVCSHILRFISASSWIAMYEILTWKRYSGLSYLGAEDILGNNIKA